MKGDEKILEVKDLNTYFLSEEGIVRAVAGLSYHVNKGESIGLVGESACGKSVSALSILRLIPNPPGKIVKGEVFFKGRDLLKASEDEMRHIRGNRISMIFQEPSTSLNPVKSIRKQISEILILHRRMGKGEALQETVNLLRLVGIPDSRKRLSGYPYQFSGGMQQRIMIAMALSCNPELLIADEPTTSLDVTVQAQILELIDGLREKFGTSVILITHNLGIVARYVDRVNVMYAGQLVESAPTEALYSRPMHPYTMGLLASVPRLDRPKRLKLSPIKGLPPSLSQLPAGCAFAPRCTYARGKCMDRKPELEQIGEDHYRACFVDMTVSV